MGIVKGVKRKAKPNPSNWQFETYVKGKKLETDILPKQISLKDKFPEVYDQIWSNCTSNAVLACDAYLYHSSKWTPSTVFTYYNQRVMDGNDFDEDDGSSVECALNALRKYGACSAKVWNNSMPWKKKPSKAAYKDGLHGYEVTSYYNVKSLLQVKKALVLGYPVVCAISWCFSYMDGTYHLSNETKEKAESCDMGHAVVIVGYDDNTGYVEIRNSWGKNWGNEGYAYISYETLKNVIWWDDTYAVVK